MPDLLTTLRQYAMTQPSKPALSGDRATISYGELPARIRQLSLSLKEAGCKVAGLAMDNGPEWILWDLACIDAGIICVPLPAFFTAEQCRHAIQEAGIDKLVTPAGLIGTGAKPVSLPAGTAKITFTSGSTGAPKGVCLSQEGLETVAKSLLRAIGEKHAGKHFSVLPLGVLLENVAGVHTALLAGCTCHIPGLASMGFANPFMPDFSTLARALHRHAATSIILVPEILRGLTAVLAAGEQSLPSLEFVAVGGAALDPMLLDDARRLGLRVYEGYGLSECGSVVTLNTPEAGKPGTAGRVLGHVNLHLSGAGEIIIDNPLCLGYTGGSCARPFHTGDLAQIDADGFVTIKGRIRNVLVTSYGRNISPEWIESMLAAEPGVMHALVYGDGLPRPRALLAPASPGADLAAAVARVNNRLPEYARIGHFHAVPPFSAADGLLTANGRLRRHEILKHYASLIAEEKPNVLRSTGS